MESGESPEQSRCGIRRTNSHTANLRASGGEGGKEAVERNNSRSSKVGSPNTSPRFTRPGAAQTGKHGAVLAFPRKEGDGSDGVPFFGSWIRSLLGRTTSTYENSISHRCGIRRVSFRLLPGICGSDRVVGILRCQLSHPYEL